MQAVNGQVALQGGTLCYQRAGQGRPLTFLHGHTLDMTMWQPQFETFETGFDVLRYDLRGYGQSSLPNDEDYLHRDDLHQLHKDLGREKSVLVGLSLGGQVALEYAIHYPESTESLILIDPFLADYNFSDNWNQTLVKILEASMMGAYQEAKQAWLESGLFTPAFEKPEAANSLNSIFGSYSGYHFENPLYLAVTPISEQLKTIKVPTLIIVGEEDVDDFVNISQYLEANIPNASLVVIPDAGHMSNLEAPHKVNEAIARFLD